MFVVDVKNTFLVVCEDESPTSPETRRSRSVPPLPVGRTSSQAMEERCGDDQLARLSSLASGRAALSIPLPRRNLGAAGPAKGRGGAIGGAIDELGADPVGAVLSDTPKVHRRRFPTLSTMASFRSNSSLRSVDTDEHDGEGSEGGASADDWEKETEKAQEAEQLRMLLELIPRDAQGNYTLVGSVGHASSNCKPCAFLQSKVGCKFGLFCDFCHFPTDHVVSGKVRFCKGKRERFRKAVAAVETGAASLEQHLPTDVIGEAAADIPGLPIVWSLGKSPTAVYNRALERLGALNSEQPIAIKALL